MCDALREAVSSGDRTTALTAVRDRLADELSVAEGSQAAALSKELRAVLAELDSLSGGAEVSALDDLSARRAHRLANAANS
jgi:hypothetical protein